VVLGAGAFAGGVVEQRAQFVLDRFHLAPQPFAVLVVCEGVPGGEQPFGERQAGLPELFLFGHSLGVAVEVALEVLLMLNSA